MRKHATVALLTLALAGVSFLPRAQAEDKGILALQQSVALLMSQLQDLQKSFNTQMGAIQGLVTQNTDTVNQLTQQLAQLKQVISSNQVLSTQQHDDNNKSFQAISDTLADITSRLQKMDQTLQQVHQLQQTIPASQAASMGAGSGMPGTVTGNPADSGTGASGSNAAQAAYQSALSAFQNNSPRTQTELATFIRTYPGDTNVPDAMYYLGTYLMGKQQYNEAIDEFSAVIMQYPSSDAAGNAELNKGLCYAKIGDRTRAIAELRALVKNYPGSEAARQGNIELHHMLGARGRG